MLTKHELRRAMGEAYGAWYWRTPGRFAHKAGPDGKAERVAYILKYRARRAELSAGTFRPEVNARGNVVLRDHDADRALRLRNAGDRYAYDFGPCRAWIQFDTRQDAIYFGVWVNPDNRQIFTYCEGDRILVTCPTPESFRTELIDAKEFYGAPIPPPLQDLLADLESATCN
jgi:hypothetical protein